MPKGRRRKGRLKMPKSETSRDSFIFLTGILLLIMEGAKQLFLYFVVFDRSYNVWYFPFQLCSVPMYLCLFYGAASFIKERTDSPRIQRALDSSIRISALFIQDFGFLGGIMALLVPEGFIWKDYPLLSAHGYLWHIILIALAIYISMRDLAYKKERDFIKTLPLFAALSVIAEILNILLSRSGGDCDMFYISPYHLSSQPVFRDIDRLIGRIPGIFVYLICVAAGAFIIHSLFCRISSLKKSR